MIEAKTISAAGPSDPILDWSGLVEEGRATLAAMSDGRWTDFNAHDPGITILELVAYALTDLGYRAGHPMSDLVAGSAPLLGPAESLTTRAVTVADIRRLGLDVMGVRNVWIEPATIGGVRLHWRDGEAASAYTIALSEDGRQWRDVRTVTAGNGGIDPIALPESEARYLRLSFMVGPADVYGLSEVTIEPLAFSATPNDFIKAVAKDAPRGWYPRGFIDEQSYWTIVGIDGGREQGLIGEDGAI